MTRIRAVQISHFRGIESLQWNPLPGVNCLIGPGDGGKSTILEAVAICLNPRRNVQFVDTDFTDLDVSRPVEIVVTLGDLPDSIANLEVYSNFLRAFDTKNSRILDEVRVGLDTVVSVRVVVDKDLDPKWGLYSERAAQQGLEKDLIWQDRVLVSPSQVGRYTEYDLRWGRGSVLNRLSEARPDASGALAQIAREARLAFGSGAQEHLKEVLAEVGEAARELGVPVGESVQALLDAGSVSVGDGQIALHSGDGIPLSCLGLGSGRLLVASLQRKASSKATIVVIDEVEQGLEPHRIHRLLATLGSKEASCPLQVMMTTHSPVVVSELSGDQLLVVRPSHDEHRCIQIGSQDTVQGTIRKYPEAFLATSVVVCEGATEVGLIRGVDAWRVGTGATAFAASGVALVNGGGVDEVLKRARVFLGLGYRTSVFRDSDRLPDADEEAAFIARGGVVFPWRANRNTEAELFRSLPDRSVVELLEHAIELYGPSFIDSQVSSATGGAVTVEACRAVVTDQVRQVLSQVSSSGSGWFKSVSKAEVVGRKFVGPAIADSEQGFRGLLGSIFGWAGVGTF